MSYVQLTITVLSTVGTIFSAIILLITYLSLISRLRYKPDVVYGTEAEKRYNKLINSTLKNGKEVDSFEFQGGKGKIIPRLEYEKCYYNSITMEPELKGYKHRVRYFFKDGDKRIVRTWYIK